MSDTVIRVENVGKKYTIGHQQENQQYTALRDVIANGAKGLVGQFRGRESQQKDLASEDFWALKDVSFEIKQGDRVGIIGRNGAGKSTLLKVLSRITEPTEGRIRILGRVASLLEVGTGFHPELTGRENIFLNGAILGMGKAEIRKKFDEIVSFSEVEKFLDTPVKRYSSGMYVRLAFSVAAHLEPEILIVDEVLAVGDVEFQKKCLGKMEEVSKHGRTVIFVSHNMAAIKSLTSACCILDRGTLAYYGKTEESIKYYFKNLTLSKNESRERKKGQFTKINYCHLLDKEGGKTSYYKPGELLIVEAQLYTDGTRGLSLEVFLVGPDGENIALGSTGQFYGINLPSTKGTYNCLLSFQPIYLASGSYTLNLATSIINVGWDTTVESACSFEVAFSNPTNTSWDFKHSYGYGAAAMLCAAAPKFVEEEVSSHLISTN